MQKITDKRQVNALAVLFSITYMVSYLTRINFAAIILEMVDATGMSKSMLTMSLTGSFIFYALGQLVSGVCGDKFSPKKLVASGLLVTAAMNFLIPVCKSHILMLIFWSINGFAQAFMWPPIVKMMAVLFTPDDYKSVALKVSWGSSVGTMLTYFIAPLIISVSSWKFVFVFSGLIAVIMLLFWLKFSRETGANAVSKAQSTKGSSLKSIFFNPLIITILFVIILMGMLKDGVSTWMPSYIAETYNLSNVVAILSGVVLPVFATLCFECSDVLHKKVFKNPLTCCGAFFCLGTVFAVVLNFTSGNSTIGSIISAAILTGSMHGANLMLITMLPPYFQRYGKVSTASGLLNCCTYIGSALSTYVVALFADIYGWGFNLAMWLSVAALGALLSFLCVKSFKKKYMCDTE